MTWLGAITFLAFVSISPIACLWVTRAAGRSSKLWWFGGVPIALLVSISGVAGIAVLSARPEIVRESQDREFSNVKSIEAAQKFLVGTWTFTEPLTNGANDNFRMWERWVIGQNGTVTIFSARPDASDWGVPEQQQYEVYSSKYADTGERYYAIRIAGQFVRAIIVADDTLSLAVADMKPVRMRRGDRIPFSK